MSVEVVFLNKVWTVLILVPMLWGMMTGKTQEMNLILSEVGKQTLQLVLPMTAITCFYSGILEIARHCGLLEALQRLLSPLLDRLLPDLKEDRETLGYIAANVVINIFGLGSAATMSGLKAMERMQKNNSDPLRPTRSMTTFLVLNTAGVTLLPTTLIALRSQFGSADPTAFLPIAIISTCCASLAGLILDRKVNYHD